MKTPIIFRLSPNTILLQWEPVISEEVARTIQYTERLLKKHFPSVIIEMTPAYTELAVHFKKNTDVSAFEEKLKGIFQKDIPTLRETSVKNITIPVCYETEFASDLAAVAKYHNISEKQLITLHTQPVYHVAFIGFLPGFPYLTGLSDTLHTPRKRTPETSIAKGSVGIGGNQTGVYPSNSPGGWNIIGRTPLNFFSVEKKQPSLLKAGDTVQFEFISKTEFELISLEVSSGRYQLKTQSL
ncbi:MAG: allophanate hydrolase [Flavobacteriaceae bacterium]|nr:allophanate hydrolase [Flavobacteriaceae bacterium]